jgi:hypothetical protein
VSPKVSQGASLFGPDCGVDGRGCGGVTGGGPGAAGSVDWVVGLGWFCLMAGAAGVCGAGP